MAFCDNLEPIPLHNRPYLRIIQPSAGHILNGFLEGCTLSNGNFPFAPRSSANPMHGPIVDKFDGNLLVWNGDAGPVQPPLDFVAIG